VEKRKEEKKNTTNRMCDMLAVILLENESKKLLWFVITFK